MRSSTTHGFQSPRVVSNMNKTHLRKTIDGPKKREAMMSSGINVFTKSPRMDNSFQKYGFDFLDHQNQRYSSNLLCLILSMLTLSS